MNRLAYSNLIKQFKELEALTHEFWVTLHSVITAPHIEELAAILKCSGADLLNGAVPLDRVEPRINDITEAFPQRPRTKLIKAWCAVVVLRDEIYTVNVGLIYDVVRRYHPTGILAVEDFYQDGALGLLKAIHRFEYRRGWRFATYAIPWIRQSITKAIGNRASTIRIPLHAQGREDLPEAHTGDYQDKMVNSAPDTTPTAEEQLINRETMEELHEYLDELEPLHRTIIERRYGFGCEAETLAQVGARVNLSRERVRQLEVAALAELRALLTGQKKPHD